MGKASPLIANIALLPFISASGVFHFYMAFCGMAPSASDMCRAYGETWMWVMVGLHAILAFLIVIDSVFIYAASQKQILDVDLRIAIPVTLASSLAIWNLLISM